MRGARQRFTMGRVATVYTTRTTPNLTVPIRTGRRATIRWARNIPRAVAISNGGRKAGVQFTNGKRPGMRLPTEADAQN
jgi:hypothetical protein